MALRLHQTRILTLHLHGQRHLSTHIPRGNPRTTHMSLQYPDLLYPLLPTDSIIKWCIIILTILLLYITCVMSKARPH